MMIYKVCQYWNNGKGFRCVGSFDTKAEAKKALAIANRTAGVGVWTVLITETAKAN